MGRPLNLQRHEPELITAIPPNEYEARRFTHASYYDTEISNVPSLSEHSTNTERTAFQAHGMLHEDGGWPRDVDPLEAEHVARYKRKAEKDDGFLPAVSMLAQRLVPVIRQNNAIDIYPRHFEPSPHLPIASTGGSASPAALGPSQSAGDSGDAPSTSAVAVSASSQSSPQVRGSVVEGSSWRIRAERDESDHSPGDDSDDDGEERDEATGKGNGSMAWLRALGALRDPIADLTQASSLLPRTAVSTTWSVAEAARGKVAIAFCHTAPAYAANVTQLRGHHEPVESFVFDIAAPHEPEYTLHPSSPVSTLAFNVREVSLIGGGCVDGTVVLFDMRRGGGAVVSARATDAGGPISSFNWLQVTSKAMEVFASSNSPVCHIWDLRRPSEPVDTMRIVLRGGQGAAGREHCATCSDYVASSVGPGKVLVGTDTGITVEMSRRGRSEADRVHAVHAGHHGPVTAVARHPSIPKLLLSAGDWTVMLWHEERRHPMLTLRARPSCVVDASWHPHHPGVLFVALENGTVEVWNLLRSLAQPLGSLSVGSGAGLHSLRPNFDGSILSAGLRSGGVELLRVHSSLGASLPHPLEAKAAMQRLIDRELGRERLAAGAGAESVVSVEGAAGSGIHAPSMTAVLPDELRDPDALDDLLDDVSARVTDALAASPRDSSLSDGEPDAPREVAAERESTPHATGFKSPLRRPQSASAVLATPTPPKAPRAVASFTGRPAAAAGVSSTL